MTLTVKDTYLSHVRLGDMGAHKNKGLAKGDAIGTVIEVGQGNRGRDEDGDGIPEPGRSSGDYTHDFIVTAVPHPDAEVKHVRTDEYGRKIFEVIDKKLAGLKTHATWPVVKEEPIRWEEEYFELWRIRSIGAKLNKMAPVASTLDIEYPPEIYRMVKWARDRRDRPYNLLQFFTFGLASQLNAWICSHFYFDAAYESTQHQEKPIILSPDGVFDQFVTPNDLINSGKMYKPRYTGLIK